MRDGDDETGDDCLNCGVCEACVERSVAAADEAADAGHVELPEEFGGEA